MELNQNWNSKSIERVHKQSELFLVAYSTEALVEKLLLDLEFGGHNGRSWPIEGGMLIRYSSKVILLCPVRPNETVAEKH